jgi:hypothetical protein
VVLIKHADGKPVIATPVCDSYHSDVPEFAFELERRARDAETGQAKWKAHAKKLESDLAVLLHTNDDDDVPPPDTNFGYEEPAIGAKIAHALTHWHMMRAARYRIRLQRVKRRLAEKGKDTKP